MIAFKEMCNLESGDLPSFLLLSRNRSKIKTEYKGLTMHRRSLWKAIIAGAAAAAIQVPSQADANIAGGYLDVVNSYRNDKISVRLDTFDPNKTLLEQNNIDLRNISTYQLGAKGQLVACNLFARGEAYWGWSDNGHYRENSTSWNGSPCKSRARLHKGRTRDYTVGGGYYLPTCGLFNVGPSGGWSYQHLQVTVNRARYNGYPDDLLNGLKFSNTWQGPWAGADAQMNFCGYELRGGYSYHWATWKGTWHQKPNKCDWQGTEHLGFTEKCKSSNARGQVAYIDVLWSMCPCIELGLGFKWQRWESHNGKEKHDKSDCLIGYSDEIWKPFDKVKNATWESYTVSLDIGVVF